MLQKFSGIYEFMNSKIHEFVTCMCHGTMTQSWSIKFHLFYQQSEFHCPYLQDIKQHGKYLSDILNFSTGKPYSTEILMASAFLGEKFQFNSCSVLSCLFWYANFLIVDSDDKNV